MNRYSELSKDEMLEICKLINPACKWEFHQVLDNDGNGTDDCYEFVSDDESCIQFNIQQSSDDEIRCYLKGNFDNDEIPTDKIKLVNLFLESNKNASKNIENDYLNYLKLSPDQRFDFASNFGAKLVEKLHSIIEEKNIFDSIGHGYCFKYHTSNMIILVPFNKNTNNHLKEFKNYRDISFTEIIIYKKEVEELEKKSLFGRNKTIKKIIDKGEYNFLPFEYVLSKQKKLSKEKIKLDKKAKELIKLSQSNFLSSEEKQLIKEIVLLFNSTYNEFIKVGENEFKKLKNSQNDILSKLDKNNKGEVNLIQNDFKKLLSKNQKQIIQVDKNYVHQFVKISNFINTKKINTQKIFESIRDTSSQEDLEERVALLKNQIHSYELLVFHSINMISALVSEDLITFYEIYESFDKLGMFNSNWENEVSEKLTNIGDKLNDLMYSIYNMEQNIVSELSHLSYVTQESFKDLNSSVTSQLREVESSINTNNLLTGIQAYQLYKINKNTKSLRG